MSIREASRVFGLHRDTVRKMLCHPVPPGYRMKRPPHSPNFLPYTGVGILEDDLWRRRSSATQPAHLRRLKKEHGFDGGYTIVKDYVREIDREKFVPLEHPPGHAQLRACVGVHRGQEAQGPLLDVKPHSDHFIKCISRGVGGVMRRARVFAFRAADYCRHTTKSPSPSWAEDVASARVRSRSLVDMLDDQGQCRGHGAMPCAWCRSATRNLPDSHHGAYGREAQGPHREHRQAHGA